jgi:hypothetical protein
MRNILYIIIFIHGNRLRSFVSINFKDNYEKILILLLRIKKSVFLNSYVMS